MNSDNNPTSTTAMVPYRQSGTELLEMAGTPDRRRAKYAAGVIVVTGGLAVGLSLIVGWLTAASMASIFALTSIFAALMLLSKIGAASGKIAGASGRLLAGDPVGAEQALVQQIEVAKHSPSLHALALYNMGVSRWVQGDLDVADGLIRRAIDSKELAHTWMDGSQSQAETTLARLCATRGHLEEARLLQDRAVEHVAPLKRATLHAAEGLIALRSGHPSRAASIFAEHWSEMIAVMQYNEESVLRIYYAFALHQLGGAEQGVRELLAGVHPFDEGQFDYVVLEWPELRRFCEDRRLVRPD